LPEKLDRFRKDTLRDKDGGARHHPSIYNGTTACQTQRET
jgi:hypothetical protein